MYIVSEIERRKAIKKLNHILRPIRSRIPFGKRYLKPTSESRTYLGKNPRMVFAHLTVYKPVDVKVEDYRIQLATTMQRTPVFCLSYGATISSWNPCYAFTTSAGRLRAAKQMRKDRANERNRNI